MSNQVEIRTTPKTAAILLLTNQMALDCTLPKGQAEAILREVLNINLDELVRAIDLTPHIPIIDSTNIPQFGLTKTLAQVPEKICNSPLNEMNYAQLGLALLNKCDSSLSALTKYGETHGKGAYLLGLIDKPIKRGGKFTPNAITKEFLLFNTSEQEELAKKLSFRIPIVQELIRSAENKNVNGFEFMGSLASKSTKVRRQACLNALLKSYNLYNNTELNRRIQNVYWNIEEV